MRRYYDTFRELFVNNIRRTEYFNMDSMHYHDGYEIYYLQEGARNIFIEDELYYIKSGTVFFMKPMEVHYSYSAKDPIHERFAINFNRDMFKDMLSDFEFNQMVSVFDKRLIILDSDRQRYVTYLLKIIENQASVSDRFSQKAALAGIMNLCCYLNTMTADNESMKSDTYITKAVKFINENYRENITLADAAKTAHLSESYFCRQFKKIVGATFLQYLINVRLKEAHVLLTTTQDTISEVAEKVGFASTAQMTRAFRQNYGISPSRLKNFNKNRELSLS